ncbi:hypothetical protein Mapa_001477 [Marchantia paleacea]|nr:hypothetical protein Mapa_001477 [Marchantia paleacea]
MAQTNSAYVLWPLSGRQRCNAEERAAYFSGLCQEEALDANGLLPRGKQASTMMELMIIRAFHSHVLRHCSLGTALGFRTRDGTLTNIPAVLVFVGRKVHSRWLLEVQRLPTTLQGPGGVWCDLDVMEFSYFWDPAVSHKEQFYSELVDALRGCDSSIGSGSQVASQETSGTLGCIVRSLTPEHELGFLTNRHVALHLDHPHQKMFHPLPPNLGPGVYLGSVERATSFITDHLWYGGVFAGLNEGKCLHHHFRRCNSKF